MDKHRSLLEVVELVNNGKLDDAKKRCEEFLNLEGYEFYAYQILGIIYYLSKDYDTSIRYFKEAINLNPGNPDVYYNLGNAFKDKGDLEEAVQSYFKAIELNHEYIEAYNNLGVVFKNKGDYENSIKMFNNAINLKPDFVEALYNLGSVIYLKGQIEEAINIYKKVLEINPEFYDSYYSLGVTYFENGQKDLATSSFKRIIDIYPYNFKGQLGYCIAQLPIIYNDEFEIEICRKKYKEELMRLKENLKYLDKKDIAEASKTIGAIQPFYLAYQCKNDVELQMLYGEIVHVIMSKSYEKFSEDIDMPDYSEDGKIRIGIVSGYFFNHSNWKIPIRGWIENINRERFILNGYYTGRVKDNITDYARKSFNKFVEDVYSFERLCEIIKNDRLHLLIYPEIGMDPVCIRLASLKLAPIQCASWGHPVTTGLPTIEYFLSSDLMEPENGQSHYSERLIRLPNLSVYCYEGSKPDFNIDRDSFGIDKNSIVYLCSQSLFKYLPIFDDVLVKIASEIENSKFLFISNPKSNYVTEMVRVRIEKNFLRNKLDFSKHVIFLPFLNEYMFKLINKISDIYLDSIGWSGCNTSFEALTYNLPIVTMPGEFMRGRHTYAMLKFLGVDETIANSLEGYIDIAVNLGKDKGLRGYISSKISLNKHKIFYDNECIKGLEEFFIKVVEGRII